LRRLKVDELPQLWNVLCGEMSLVGPRPVVPELAIEYLRAYKLLLEVRPGLTDPATLKYCHEEEFLSLVLDPLRYYRNILVPDKLRISAAYMHHANVWSDLAVLAATALTLIPVNWITQSVGAWSFTQDTAAERYFPESGQSAGGQTMIE
jgi:lipopolysaccharide/colanic/teichoic acid biosynthesis glycosyltransferase